MHVAIITQGCGGSKVALSREMTPAGKWGEPEMRMELIHQEDVTIISISPFFMTESQMHDRTEGRVR